MKTNRMVSFPFFLAELFHFWIALDSRMNGINRIQFTLNTHDFGNKCFMETLIQI